MIFKSKVDRWVHVVIAIEFVIVVIASVLMLKVKGIGGLIGIAPAAVVGLGFPLWLLFSIRYEVTLDKLIVRAAWKTWEIPKVNIHGVKPSRSLMSSPALSLDRLEIRYGNNETLMVSPQDKEAFIAALGLPKQGF